MGETFLSLLEHRAPELIAYLNHHYAGKTVVIFTHGSFSSAVRVLMNDPAVFDQEGWIDGRTHMLKPAIPYDLQRHAPVIPAVAEQPANRSVSPIPLTAFHAAFDEAMKLFALEELESGLTLARELHTDLLDYMLAVRTRTVNAERDDSSWQMGLLSELFGADKITELPEKWARLFQAQRAPEEGDDFRDMIYQLGEAIRVAEEKLRDPETELLEFLSGILPGLLHNPILFVDASMNHILPDTNMLRIRLGDQTDPTVNNVMEALLVQHPELRSHWSHLRLVTAGNEDVTSQAARLISPTDKVRLRYDSKSVYTNDASALVAVALGISIGITYFLISLPRFPIGMIPFAFAGVFTSLTWLANHMAIHFSAFLWPRNPADLTVPRSSSESIELSKAA